MANTTKYMPDVVERLYQAISLGASYEHACAYAGISVQTFWRWRQTNSEFCDALKSAEARGVVALLAKIEKAASDGNWQAAAWKLERRYPHLYGRRVTLLPGAAGPPTADHEHVPTPPSLAARLRRALRGGTPPALREHHVAGDDAAGATAADDRLPPAVADAEA